MRHKAVAAWEAVRCGRAWRMHQQLAATGQDASQHWVAGMQGWGRQAADQANATTTTARTHLSAAAEQARATAGQARTHLRRKLLAAPGFRMRRRPEEPAAERPRQGRVIRTSAVAGVQWHPLLPLLF